ncbi:hypothetical protein TNCV_3315431 [Trichonephila clavipes]|nr:hypothetical protein TNCV_3315431 [Trichonephila clavipes]
MHSEKGTISLFHTFCNLIPPHGGFVILHLPCVTTSLNPSLPLTNFPTNPSRCPEGFTITEDGKNCTDANECLSDPCLNGGSCVNLPNGEGYYCICPDGFGGLFCGARHEEKVMRLSMAALAAILICLLNILTALEVFADIPMTGSNASTKMSARKRRSYARKGAHATTSPEDEVTSACAPQTVTFVSTAAATHWSRLQCDQRNLPHSSWDMTLWRSFWLLWRRC